MRQSREKSIPTEVSPETRRNGTSKITPKIEFIETERPPISSNFYNPREFHTQLPYKQNPRPHATDPIPPPSKSQTHPRHPSMEILSDSLTTTKSHLRKNMELIKLRLGDRVQFTTNQNFNLSLSNQSKTKPKTISKNHSYDKIPQKNPKNDQIYTNREPSHSVFLEKKNNIFKVKARREGSKEKIGD